MYRYRQVNCARVRGRFWCDRKMMMFVCIDENLSFESPWAEKVAMIITAVALLAVFDRRKLIWINRSNSLSHTPMGRGPSELSLNRKKTKLNFSITVLNNLKHLHSTSKNWMELHLKPYFQHYKSLLAQYVLQSSGKKFGQNTLFV